MYTNTPRISNEVSPPNVKTLVVHTSQLTVEAASTHFFFIRLFLFSFLFFLYQEHCKHCIAQNASLLAKTFFKQQKIIEVKEKTKEIY